MWTSFALAARVLTTLPPLAGEPPSRTEGRRAVALFPLVGALVGLALAAVWALSGRLWAGQPLVAAALTLAAQTVLTAGRGPGGVARAADGWAAHGSGGDRSGAFAVMRDPRRGTTGLVVLGVALLLKLALLAALPPRVAWPGLLLTATLGGWANAFAASAFPFASAGVEGDAGAGLSEAGPNEFLAATVLTILCAAVLPARGLLVLVAVALVAAPVAQMIQRRLGGFNRPLSLALGELAEIVALACLALRPA